MPKSLKEINMKYEEKSDKIVSLLPAWAVSYFDNIKKKVPNRTSLAYAQDIYALLSYLVVYNSKYKDIEIKKFGLSKIRKVNLSDLLDYQKYIATKSNIKPASSANLSRRTSSIRSMFKYLYKTGTIKSNPADLLEFDKSVRSPRLISEKEMHNLITYMECCEDHLNEHQLKYFSKTKLRDIAMVYLLYSTGITVSDLVLLNLDDVDTVNFDIRIYDKSDKTNESFVYVRMHNKAAEFALLSYLNNSRDEIIAADGHEDAMFLSMQKKRMSISSVERMVKKYSILCNEKNISPSIFRNTYRNLVQ